MAWADDISDAFSRRYKIREKYLQQPTREKINDFS